MIKIRLGVAAVCLTIFSGVSEAKTIMATVMSEALWSDLSKGALSDTMIEFQKGDDIPLSFVAEGDLIESSPSTSTYVKIKRNFWILVQENKFQMSLDGINFKNISDVVSGALSAGAASDQSGGIANTFTLGLKAYLK